MGTATYRIGPSDYFSPGDLQADAQTLDAQVDVLDSQIELNTEVTPDFTDQWTAWHGRWKVFADDHFGGWFSSFLASWNDANRDQLIAFERQFDDFATEARTFGAAGVIGPVGPSAGAQDTFGAHAAKQFEKVPSVLPSTTGVITIAILAVVAFVLYKKFA